MLRTQLRESKASFQGRQLLSLFAVTFLIVAAGCSETSLRVSLEDTGPGPEDNARLEWFREARFGMFIHWGLYAVPAGEWAGKQNYG
jgi:hypothetical protein